MSRTRTRYLLRPVRWCRARASIMRFSLAQPGSHGASVRAEAPTGKLSAISTGCPAGFRDDLCACSRTAEEWAYECGGLKPQSGQRSMLSNHGNHSPGDRPLTLRQNSFALHWGQRIEKESHATAKRLKTLAMTNKPTPGTHCCGRRISPKITNAITRIQNRP